MDSPMDYAERFGLVDILPPELVESLRLVRRAPGELLVSAGDRAEDLYFFVEGAVKTYCLLENGHSVLAAFLQPFDVLGEVELFDRDRYLLSVEAMAESIFLRLGFEAVRKSADRNGRLFAFFCGRLASKLARSNVAGSINLRYPVENRLASYLLGATGREGLILGGEDLGDLADFIGASYRQLARVLRSFRDRGILADVRGALRVLDRGKLKELARDSYDRIWEGTSARTSSRLRASRRPDRAPQGLG